MKDVKQKEDKNRDEVMQKTLEYEGNSWRTAYAYGASHPRQRQIIIKFNSIKKKKKKLTGHHTHARGK